ncbi:helix-turn-helix domain-containing protein [Vagococcus intermedius]|uniref:Helix-turn-helix domain-containing protein n=1 Tax=Vagococcus intermedius TaxID=2991418 RepID=A0AAF0CWM1_9ENTE|nr:helix-turn-helix domain-containing protein [Vagococcus intermedius]WEG74228.1 helix-turn-helix domain-containing protein [Vagococcus intermedius]WEG76310.1 helix-turn-helix domain-containing protein [Vagococcus intermedius]
MKIEDFLEKKEIQHLTILKKIDALGGTVSHIELRQHLNLNKPTLDRALDEITFFLREFRDNYCLTVNEALIVIERQPNFSIEAIYSVYLKQSLKYQILDYAFKHREFTVFNIIHDLMISESTLFRKTKEINYLLKEFKIQLKNGNILGEELQIRYFYFLMYQAATPYHQLSEKVLTEHNMRLIQSLEKTLTMKLPSYSYTRIGLWLMISKKRIKYTKKVYRKVRKKMFLYESDWLYKKVRQFVLLYTSRYSIEVVEEESMLHFIFVASMSIFHYQDFTSYDLLRGRRTPNAMMDTMLRERILLEYLPQKPTIKVEQQITYYLSQANSLLYFFEGAIITSEQWDFREKTINLNQKITIELVEELLAKALEAFSKTPNSSDDLHYQLKHDYLNILAMIDFKIAKELRIAIELDMIESHAEILTQLIKLDLASLIGVSVETFSTKKNYDLVITNTLKYHRLEDAKQIVVISNSYSKYDRLFLKQKINDLRQ